MSPLRFLLVVLVAFAGLVGLAAGGVLAYGRAAVWTDLFGPADLGPYDFDQPTRTGKMNDALACPANSAGCLQAGYDRAIPLFAVDGPTLYAAARARVAALPWVEVVEDAGDRLVFRAVVRTPVFGFPDTLSFRVREVEPGRSALWLYSRSQIGHADLGTNERRLRQIIRALRRTLPVVPAGG
jgi:uncharacterized protein (DUF1499 family)